MATKKKASAKITLRTVINHVQMQHQVVLGEIGSLKKDMGTMKGDIGTLKSDVGILKDDVSLIRRDLTGMERRLSTQICNIDQRLDDLEVNVIPAVKKEVGIR